MTHIVVTPDPGDKPRAMLHEGNGFLPTLKFGALTLQWLPSDLDHAVAQTLALIEEFSRLHNDLIGYRNQRKAGRAAYDAERARIKSRGRGGEVTTTTTAPENDEGPGQADVSGPGSGKAASAQRGDECSVEARPAPVTTLAPNRATHERRVEASARLGRGLSALIPPDGAA